jgi:uncharacterized protein (DUF849 family)
MEDSVYIKRGELVKSNAQLVEKGIGIIESLGGSIATPIEARTILGLPL